MTLAALLATLGIGGGVTAPRPYLEYAPSWSGFEGTTWPDDTARHLIDGAIIRAPASTDPTKLYLGVDPGAGQALDGVRVIVRFETPGLTIDPLGNWLVWSPGRTFFKHLHGVVSGPVVLDALSLRGVSGRYDVVITIQGRAGPGTAVCSETRITLELLGGMR